MTSVDFRGERVEVEYRDYGYDHTCNAHDIDWHFVEDRFNDVDLTEDENDSIVLQLAKIADDDYDDDVL